MSLDAAQLTTVTGLSIGTAAFSFLGSLFILACFFAFRQDEKSFGFTLVAYMAGTDSLISLAKLFGNAGSVSTGFCYFQAVLMSYFEVSSILWALALAFTLHMAFLRGDPRFSAENIGALHQWYHVVWIIALIVTILPTSTDSYGEAGGWCWIQNRNGADVAWRIIQFYGILWIAWGYSSFVYVSVALRLRAQAPAQPVVRRIMYYPLVLVVCWMGATVRRLVEVLSGSGAPYGLVLWHVILSGLYGFCNAIVYGLTPSIRARLLVAMNLHSRKVDKETGDETIEVPPSEDDFAREHPPIPSDDDGATH